MRYVFVRVGMSLGMLPVHVYNHDTWCTLCRDAGIYLDTQMEREIFREHKVRNFARSLCEKISRSNFRIIRHFAKWYARNFEICMSVTQLTLHITRKVHSLC